MEKLFAALREQHLGFEVVDVRFMVSQREVKEFDLDRLDEQLAHAVNTAERIDLALQA